jgi:hypothetical protein
MRAWTGVVTVLFAALTIGCDWFPAPAVTTAGNADSTDVAGRSTVDVNMTGTWRGTPDGHQDELITIGLEHTGEDVKGTGTVARADSEAALNVLGTTAFGRFNLSMHSEDDEEYNDVSFLGTTQADTLTGTLKMDGHEHTLTLHRITP